MVSVLKKRAVLFLHQKVGKVSVNMILFMLQGLLLKICWLTACCLSRGSLIKKKCKRLWCVQLKIGIGPEDLGVGIIPHWQ